LGNEVELDKYAFSFVQILSNETLVLLILFGGASELRIFAAFVVDVDFNVISGEILKHKLSLRVHSKRILEYIPCPA
jgi:hypothetical protein